MKNVILIVGMIAILGLTVFIGTPVAAIGTLPTTATPANSTPASPDVLVEQARLLYRANRPSAAQILLNQVILNPESSDIARYRAYFLRGELYQDQAAYEAAIQDYSNAIALQPNLSEVYAFRATALFAIGDYDAAIADYDAAIASDPSEPNYYLARGIIRIQQQDFATAIDDFTTALAIDDELAVAYRERGLAAYALDQIGLASTDLQRYLVLAPNAPDRDQITTILEDLE